MLERVPSSGASATTNNVTSASQKNQTTNFPPVSPQYSDNWARFVSENAFKPSSGSTPSTSAPSSTFGSDPHPAYDPNTPADLSSNNGRVAANGLLRMEQFGPEYNPQSEAQLAAQTLGQHKNDPAFLQQYLGTLGSSRTAQIFSNIASLGNVQTPFNYTSGAANPQQLKQEYQNIADSLSTLAKNNDFSQSDMDQFATQFAKTNPQVNFFAKDVLSSASPQVNQMFFESAKNYALQNSGSSAGQAMAAYAMQALSQTSNPLPQLESLPAGQLNTLVKAAMQGEAAYGNPPTLDDYAKTGVFRAQNGQGAPLTGLTNLMFDAAYAGTGDRYAPAPLSSSQAQDLNTKLFKAAVGTLESDPAVKSFYTQSPSGQGVSMKDALASEFTQSYASIVKSYSGPDGELSSSGMSAFREFFADAVFSPPPSAYALGAVQTIQSRLASYIAEAKSAPSNGQPSQQQTAYAESLGEQAQAMAAGLKASFASILNGAAQADQSTQNLINGILSVGGAVVGTAGPEASVGTAIVGEAVTLLVNSGSGSGPSDVQAAVHELASHGINVNGYDPGAFYDLSTKIDNDKFRAPLQAGLNNGATVLYNG